MKLFTNKLILVFLGSLILIVVIPLIVFFVLTEQKGHITGGGLSWPVISRTVPAFASSEYSPASYANDDSYDTTWRSHGTPTWLAYDLSGVPASHRGKVLVVWYNESYNYDHTIINYY